MQFSDDKNRDTTKTTTTTTTSSTTTTTTTTLALHDYPVLSSYLIHFSFSPLLFSLPSSFLFPSPLDPLLQVVHVLLRKGASVTALDSKGYNAALACCPSDNVAECLALILDAMFANFAVSASSGVNSAAGAGLCAGNYGVNGTAVGYHPGVGLGGYGVGNGVGLGVGGAGLGYSSGAVPPSLHNSFSLPLNLRNSLLLGGPQGPLGSLWGGCGSDGYAAHSSLIGGGLACIPPHNKLSIHSTDSFSLRLTSPPPGGNNHHGNGAAEDASSSGVGVGLRNGDSGGGGSTSSSLGSQDALDMGLDGAANSATTTATSTSAAAFDRNGSRQSPDNDFY